MVLKFAVPIYPKDNIQKISLEIFLLLEWYFLKPTD